MERLHSSIQNWRGTALRQRHVMHRNGTRNNPAQNWQHDDRNALHSWVTLAKKHFYIILIPTLLLVTFATDKYLCSKYQKDVSELETWLNARGFKHPFSQRLVDEGVGSLEQLCLLGDRAILRLFQFPPGSSSAEHLKEEFALLKEELLLKQWLEKLNLLDIYDHLSSNDCKSLRVISSKRCKFLVDAALQGDEHRAKTFRVALGNLERAGIKYHSTLYVTDRSNYLLQLIALPWKMLSFAATVLFYGFLGVAVVVIGSLMYKMLKKMQRDVSGKYGEKVELASIVVGNYFDPLRTKLSFPWKEPCVVGQLMSMSVKFYKHNLMAYNIGKLRSYKVEIIAKNETIPVAIHTDNEKLTNCMVVEFTPKVAGLYTITVLVNGHLASSKPIVKRFLPGGVDPSKTRLDLPSNVVLMREGLTHTLNLIEHDKYGNVCAKSAERIIQYLLETRKLEDGEEEFHPCVSAVDSVIDIRIFDAGCYCLRVSFGDVVIQNGVVTLLVLSASQWKEVQQNAQKPSWNLWYEAYLLVGASPTIGDDSWSSSIDWGDVSKRKKVYCYVSSKMITVKEFHFKIFSKTLFSIKLKPMNKMHVVSRRDPASGLPCFVVERGLYAPVVFACSDRNVFMATFTQLVLNNVGGSYTFERKRSYFHAELNRIYGAKADSRIKLLVSRNDIVKSSMKQTRHFSVSDWSKNFEVTFVNEPGMDYGGVSREWFQVLSQALFDPKRLLFKTFQEDNQQALIHPNPQRPEKLEKLSYFEFSGRLVGKALLECSYGKIRQQYIKARFTRAFLSQIIGLGVHWKHFESDDKDLYNGKIKYILENDPEELAITFTDEIYGHDGRYLKTVDLKAMGSKIDVCEENKVEYLKLLAEYRLSLSVRDEIEAFSKGLTEVIPEGLLSMFDENELELLICGMESISIADLKSNCILAGTSAQFEKVMEWFWCVVSGFNAEELARLLQFTTGCSQLPPGGFADLRPKFQFVPAPSVDALPTAHTCFNCLCLPDYTSMQELKKKLLFGISEGNEGFGFM